MTHVQTDAKKNFGRRHAGVLFFVGAVMLVSDQLTGMAMAKDVPMVVGFSPVFVALGLSGLVDPRVLDALLNYPGTPRWAFVVAPIAFLIGLAAGGYIVFEAKGGFPT